MIARAIDWCAVNSGSRNVEGLGRTAAILEPVLAAFPGKVETIVLDPSREVADDGSIRLQPHGDALRLTAVEAGEQVWRPSKRRGAARRKAT